MECPHCHQSAPPGAAQCPACGADLRPPLLRCLWETTRASHTSLLLIGGGALFIILGFVAPEWGNLLADLISIFAGDGRSSSSLSASGKDPVPLFVVGGGLVLAGLAAIGVKCWLACRSRPPA